MLPFFCTSLPAFLVLSASFLPFVIDLPYYLLSHGPLPCSLLTCGPWSWHEGLKDPVDSVLRSSHSHWFCEVSMLANFSSFGSPGFQSPCSPMDSVSPEDSHAWQLQPSSGPMNDQWVIAHTSLPSVSLSEPGLVCGGPPSPSFYQTLA